MYRKYLETLQYWISIIVDELLYNLTGQQYYIKWFINVKCVGKVYNLHIIIYNDDKLINVDSIYLCIDRSNNIINISFLSIVENEW